MTEILAYDQFLFHLINSEWSNSFFDYLLPVIRNKYIWFPLYIFLLSFLWLNFKKTGLRIIIVLAIVIGVADATSSHLIKKSVKRARPCHVMEQPQDMNLLIRCGSGYSFPSSHATNHFAIAVFLGLALGKIFKWIKIPLLVWAFLIAYAQVYVGVHYPVDVITGGVLGTIIGSAGYFIFKRFIRIHLSE